ncbi:MAG: hypothetical protein JWN86_1325 [Planctomycetota bacterium]|nr:hypothetical protein [Planctomycetota bacterium]
MSSVAKMQFYVVTRDQSGGFDLQRLDLESSLQVRLTQEFLKQSKEFVDVGIQKLSFHATFTPSPDSITSISPFDIPLILSRGMDKPQEFHKIQMPFTPKAPVVRAILGIDNGTVTGQKGYYFQHFDRSHILQTGSTVLFRGGMFYSMVDPGVKIADRLMAVISGNELLFRSYFKTNQFLDLSAHFREASDEDITTVLQHEKLTKADPSLIIKMCKPVMRKKFSAILFTKVLDHEKATPDRIQGGMKRFFGVKLDIKIDRTGKRRIVFPIDPLEVGHLLAYLTDSVYESDLTGEHRTSNSHRPLS